MTGDIGRTGGAISQGNKKVSGMDLLKQEASTVPQSQKPNEYSAELDALVSDLMKQVIQEAEQQSGPAAESDSVEDLLAEFLPLQAKPLTREAKDPKSDPASKQQNAAASVQIDEALERARGHKSSAVPAAKPAAPEIAPKTNTLDQKAPIFAPTSTNKRRSFLVIPVCICFLIAVGIAAYFYMNRASSKQNQGAEQSAATNEAAPAIESRSAESQLNSSAPSDQETVVSPPSKNHPTSVDAVQQSSVVPQQAVKSSNRADKKVKSGDNAATIPQAKMEQHAPITEAPQVLAASKAPAEKPETAAASDAAQIPDMAPEIKTPQSIPPAPKPSPVAPSTPMSAVPIPPEPQPAIPAAVKQAASAVPISRANPKYPELAIRARASATVTLDVSIDNQGKVIKAVPVSGPVLFHDEAIRAAMKWRYKPASVDGINVSSQSKITFNFNFSK